MEQKPKTIPFGAKPTATTSKPKTIPFGSAPTSKTAPEKKGDGIFATLVKDPIETLLVKPADRFAETLGRTGLFGKDAKEGYEMMADKGEGRRIFGMDIEAQQALGDGGAKQIGGEALKSLSYLYAGGAAPGAVRSTLAGKAAQGAARLGKEGLISGGAYGAGEEMTQKDSTFEDVLKSGAVGAGLGLAGGAALGAAAPVVAKAISPAERALKRSQEAKNALRRILGGKQTIKDAEIAERAFKEIDTEGITTNADLAKRLDDKIAEISTSLDEALETDPTLRPMERLNHTIDVNGQKVTKNYVNEALDQLENEYVKTNNAEGAALVQQIRDKANSTGLTTKEINDVARMHGKDLNAYNLNGQLSSGLAKQTAENTRAGLKKTARSLFGNKISGEADRSISDLMRVKKLITDRAEAVNKLKSSIVDPSMLQRLGGLLEKVLNISTLGSSRALVSAALRAGGKQEVKLSAVQLEKMLAKDLKLIQEAIESGASEETIIKKLNQFVKNNSETLFLPAPSGKTEKPLFGTPGGRVGTNMQEAMDIAAVETGKAKTPKTDGRRMNARMQKNQESPGLYPFPKDLPSFNLGPRPKKNLNDLYKNLPVVNID